MYDILFYYFPGYHQTLFRIYFQQNIAAMLRQRSTAHGFRPINLYETIVISIQFIV